MNDIAHSSARVPDFMRDRSPLSPPKAKQSAAGIKNIANIRARLRARCLLNGCEELALKKPPPLGAVLLDSRLSSHPAIYRQERV